MTWRTSSRKNMLRGAGKTGWEEQADAKQILRRDRNACYYRGPDCIGHATEVDHVTPLYITGPAGDHPANKRAICVPCHRAKSRLELVASRRPPRRRPAEAHPGTLGGDPR